MNLSRHALHACPASLVLLAVACATPTSEDDGATASAAITKTETLDDCHPVPASDLAPAVTLTCYLADACWVYDSATPSASHKRGAAHRTWQLSRAFGPSKGEVYGSITLREVGTYADRIAAGETPEQIRGTGPLTAPARINNYFSYEWTATSGETASGYGIFTVGSEPSGYMDLCAPSPKMAASAVKAFVDACPKRVFNVGVPVRLDTSDSDEEHKFARLGIGCGFTNQTDVEFVASHHTKRTLYFAPADSAVELPGLKLKDDPSRTRLNIIQAVANDGI